MLTPETATTGHVDGRDDGRCRRRPMSTKETATTMAEVDARPRSPARRRHHPLLPLPIPLRRRTRRDCGRVRIHSRRRSGDDVPPLLRVVVILAMMPPPSSVGRPPATPHPRRRVVIVPAAAGSGIVRYGRVASFTVVDAVVVTRHHRQLATSLLELTRETRLRPSATRSAESVAPIPGMVDDNIQGRRL